MVIQVYSDREKMGSKEFSKIVRMAQTLRTRAVIAIVDAEDEVNFYEVGRFTP